MMMMMKSFFTLSLLFVLCACGGSDDNTGKDMTPPEIISKGIVAVPTDCHVFKPGEVIPFNYVFKDDTELGSYNIEVHNNFDHHTHSTSAVECEMDAKKSPQNPWIFNKDYAIPAGEKLFTARVDIPIPADCDEGDYHFMVRLTDRAGWQTLHAVAIKVKK